MFPFFLFGRECSGLSCHVKGVRTGRGVRYFCGRRRLDSEGVVLTSVLVGGECHLLSRNTAEKKKSGFRLDSVLFLIFF